MSTSIFILFCLLTTVFLITGPTEAQQPKNIPRIGFLIPGSRPTYAVRIEAFQNGLRELGYIEGESIVTEWRFADGKGCALLIPPFLTSVNHEVDG